MLAGVLRRLKAEKIFEIKVKRYLDSVGAWYVKFFANRYTESGIPDILACIDGHFVGVEVKAMDGKPSGLQLSKVGQIRKAGGFAFVLYPSGFEEFKKFVEDLKQEKYNMELPVVIK